MSNSMHLVKVLMKVKQMSDGMRKDDSTEEDKHDVPPQQDMPMDTQNKMQQILQN